MLRLALAVFVFQTLHAAEAVREVSSDAFIMGGQPLPGFYKGYFYFIDGRTNIRVYARDGHLAFTTGIQEKSAILRNIAFASDGTAAISWSTDDKGIGRHAGIELLDANGRPTGSIDTGVYLAYHLAFGDDQALWTFGWQLGGGPAGSQPDYPTVRKFSRDGKPIGAWLPHSAFPKGLQPAAVTWQEPRITLIKDRVGLRANSGHTGAEGEWLELDLQGNLLGRWRLDDCGSAQVALTTDGHVYVQKGNGPANYRFFVLDRSAAVWKPIMAPTTDRLYGADGDKLVFAATVAGRMHWRWFNQP